MNLPDIALSMKLVLGLMALATLLPILLRGGGHRTNSISSLLLLGGSLILLGISLQTLLGYGSASSLIRVPTMFPQMDLTFRLDGVSAYFSLLLSILSSCVALYSIGYGSLEPAGTHPARLTGLIAVFVLSMVLVFSAGDMLAFYLAWELMAFISYFLVIHHASKESQDAGLVYILMTCGGTVFLLIALMLMYAGTGTLQFNNLIGSIPEGQRSLIFILLLIGFGTKAGIVPLHIWLPLAHPAAPSQASALMSGIMIKTAVYGLVRFVFIIMGVQAVWWGVLLLLTGILTTVIGVAYAYLENNFKKLLANSSIENIGIILMGLGIAAIGQAYGNELMLGLGLTAAMLHTFNHGLFKSLLFLCSGNVYSATHTKNLEVLGGLMKTMPHTGILTLIGAIALSAAVPLNGFISEWLTYRSFLNVLQNGTAMAAFAAMLAVVALAFAGVMATAAMVKTIGVAFLGVPRSEAAAHAHEMPWLMVAPGYVLAFLCLMAGIFPYSILGMIQTGFSPIAGMDQVLHYNGDLGFFMRNLSLGDFGVFPVNTFALLMLSFVLALTLPGIFNRNRTHRTYNTWDCGFIKQNSRMQYTATGFSKPLAVVFRMLYKPARELKIEKGMTPYHPKSMRYTIETEPIFEKYLYWPLSRFAKRISTGMRSRVQTGSIHAYLSYIFITVIVLIVYNIIR